MKCRCYCHENEASSKNATYSDMMVSFNPIRFFGSGNFH